MKSLRRGATRTGYLLNTPPLVREPSTHLHAAASLPATEPVSTSSTLTPPRRKGSRSQTFRTTGAPPRSPITRLHFGSLPRARFVCTPQRSAKANGVGRPDNRYGGCMGGSLVFCPSARSRGRSPNGRDHSASKSGPTIHFLIRPKSRLRKKG